MSNQRLLNEIYCIEASGMKMDDKNSELRYACYKGDLTRIMALVYLGADINTYKGYPLKVACEFGYREVVDFLISEGAIVEDNFLLRAVIDGHKEIVQILLASKVNVFADHHRALNYAVYNNHLDMIKLILFYYPDGDYIKQYFPQLFSLYNQQLNAVIKLQLKFLDILWRPGGKMCNKNYEELTAIEQLN